MITRAKAAGQSRYADRVGTRYAKLGSPSECPLPELQRGEMIRQCGGGASGIPAGD